MTEPELKPCPFCGGPAEADDGGNTIYGRYFWAVGCQPCAVVLTDREEWKDGLLVLPAQECIERWNKRAPEINN